MNRYIGTNVEVITVETYWVKCKCFDGTIWYFKEEDLQEIVHNTQSTKNTPSNIHTITLSLSDTKSTMSDGIKTVEVNRYHTDKYDEKETIKELMKKFYAKPKKMVKMLIENYTKNEYGIIGEQTDLTDSFGEKLYVGDMIKTSFEGDVFILTVAKSKTDYIVMGYGNMNANDGLITCKIKSYKDITE